MAGQPDMMDSLSAADLLREDHAHVKQLFEDFENAEDDDTKQEVVDAALKALKIHTMLEEQIFYPAVRRELEEEDIVDEAEEEHKIAKALIAELEGMTPQDDHFDAKFTVLAESVRHHIDEEENEMLPRAESGGVDMFELGDEMVQRKQEITGEVESGVSPRRVLTASQSRPAKRSKTARRARSR
jgi:hemerythrin-like domain-containing protein